MSASLKVCSKRFSPQSLSFPFEAFKAMALIAAAYFGNVFEITEALRDGEDIESADPDGCRALHASVITEQEDAAKYLLRPPLMPSLLVLDFLDIH